MPTGLADLSFVDPHLRAASGYVSVPGGGPALPSSPIPLSVSIAGAGRMSSLEEWNAATYGTSLVVVVDGTVVHEWYADGVGPDSLLLGASMTKSVLAHLVGRAVAASALSLADPVVDHVPALAATGWAACTVRDVMSMTSGVDWVEDHRDPAGPASRLIGCFAPFGAGSSRDLLLTIGPGRPVGTQWEYCTADSQVLDWVREAATGTAYAEALGELWRDLGCSSDAVIGVDADGVALAGGGLAATARDWARIALAQLSGPWADLTSAPGTPYTRPGRLPSSITTHAGFGLHWWPLDDAGRRVTADGSRGQFAYADRDLGVVVVKTSQWPYADWLVDRQLRDLSYLGLPEVARFAAEGGRS